MLNTVKTTVISAMIAIGTISAVPASASAGDLTVRVGGGFHFSDGGSGFGIYFGESGHSHRWDRPRHYKRRFCTPRRAVRKAERMGLRRARVGHVNHRTIGVKGRRHGHRVYVVFARAPRCPVLY